MKVLLLSRYGRMGASSRLRMLQFLPFLQAKGWTIHVAPFFSDDYLLALYAGRSRWRPTVAGYWRRAITLCHFQRYDVIWLEKEFFPFLPASAEKLLARLRVPYVVDYDDAWFHRYDLNGNRFIRFTLRHKIDAVMRHSALVIAGNDYLAERAYTAEARRIEIVPTVVDIDRYPLAQPRCAKRFVIGWIGSPSTSRYLVTLQEVFHSLARKFNVTFVAIGGDKGALAGLPVEVLPWDEDTEGESIGAFDVGIMPLPDSPWERGKCGYKLVQYMACGCPVVASPVGVNVSIVEHGVNGFLAKTPAEWEDALTRLLQDGEGRRRMGMAGRIKVEKWYSLQVQAPRLERMMREVMG